MKKLNVLTRMLLLVALLVGSTSSVWADDSDYIEAYTFSITKPSSGALSDYTKTEDMVIDGITWNVPGNWYATGALRLGGKSINNVDRTITGKGAITEKITKITVNHSGKTSDNLTLNSVTITVASDADFTKDLITKTVTPTISKKAAGSFDLTPDVECPAGRYYKIAFNISNSNSSNYAFVLNSIVFYKDNIVETKHTLSSAVLPLATGTVTLGATSVAEGKTTTIVAEPEDGYYFVNWTYTGTGATIENLNAASTNFTMGTSDAVVTANFAVINYWAITYDYNDGETESEEVRVLKDEADSYNLKAAPSRHGYIFTGWKIGETTYAAGAAYEPTSDVTAQAQWEFDSSTLITYNKSAKSDLATGAKYVLGASYTSSSITTWKYCKNMGSDTYLHADVVGEHGSLNASKAVFFDEAPEIITLNETADGWEMITENGKIGLKGDKKLDYDQGDTTWDLGGTDEVPTLSATFEKEGTPTTYIMKFNWNNGSSRFNAYTSGQQDVYFYRLDNGKNVYTLTLDFNDGETANGTHRVLEDASYTLTAPTRDDYTFTGWNTEIDGKGTNYGTGAYTMPAEATTLYAQWRPNTVSATVTSAGWATYVTPYAVEFSEGVAYVVTAAGTSTTLEAVTKVPADTPVLLKDEGTKTATVIASATAPASNLLKVSDGNVNGDDEYIYVLARRNNVTGFYLWDSTASAIPAGKVYLYTKGTPAKGLEFISFENAETDGIRSIENGKMRIENSNYYNLAGQRVGKDYKGIVIVNGKKMLNK